MYRLVYPTIVQNVYEFKVRAGSRHISLVCKWNGLGSIEFKVTSPKKTFCERDLSIRERTDIHVKNGASTYQYNKEASLDITPPADDETWTLELRVSKILDYVLTIETH